MIDLSREGDVHRHAGVRYLVDDALPGGSEAADRLARALRQAGVRLEYRGWSSGQDHEPPPGLFRQPRDPLPSERAVVGAPTIAHVAPDALPQIRAAFPDGPLISHLDWETDRLPAYWPGLLNQVDRVIVPSEWNREIVVGSGVTTPVAIVPHVAGDPVPGDGGVFLRLPADPWSSTRSAPGTRAPRQGR